MVAGELGVGLPPCSLASSDCTTGDLSTLSSCRIIRLTSTNEVISYFHACIYFLCPFVSPISPVASTGHPCSHCSVIQSPFTLQLV